MSSVVHRYRGWSRRRYRHAARGHTRLDIQGLRMVAVLTVFACHLWHWPRGGFVGVDVFFVISGFLITGNLLRSAEANGTVSFRTFYWNRIRRIVPAATVVLVLTWLAAVWAFQPFRAHQVGVDAVFAFIFLSNWRFAFQGTDYFVAGATVSPIQHYWSLSIEEQFYFVWPALIFLISVFVLRKAWTHSHRMRIAGYVMAGIVAASLAWALYETAHSATWAYFNTFARVWELGGGALLACAVGALARIPAAVRPWLSWAGLTLIAASLVLISESSAGFPAPWALLPVCGAALVIAAGVGGEPRYQHFLRNPVATYIGDISYSLYLVHWPIIVILAAVMGGAGAPYSVAVVAASFGMAIASYHFVENPLRRADWAKAKGAYRDLVKRRKRAVKPSTKAAGVGALALLTLGLVGFVLQPVESEVAPPSVEEVTAAEPGPAGSAAPTTGPEAKTLHGEIVAALQARQWPNLNPSMESVIQGPLVAPDIGACGQPFNPDLTACTWGSGTAPVRAVIIGDSIALTYIGPLRQIAENSNGQLQLHTEAMFGCQFVDDLIVNSDERLQDGCPARKQHAADVINTMKPDIVFVANSYGEKSVSGRDGQMSAGEWADSMKRYVDSFRGSVGKVVFLSPPPMDVNISECFGTQSNPPAKCISRVTSRWREMAEAERGLAQTLGGAWVDSRPWFCSAGKLCPSFVGTLPTKRDAAHMSPEYGQRIAPVIAESLKQAGLP